MRDNLNRVRYNTSVKVSSLSVYRKGYTVRSIPHAELLKNTTGFNGATGNFKRG